MNENRWAQMERTCLALASVLVKEGVPLEPVQLAPETEKANDDWVRRYAKSAALPVFPTDPMQRRGLLARFLTGASAIANWRKSTSPLAAAAGEEAGLEDVLVDVWHGALRRQWLRGPKKAGRN